jgi:xylan 1,4-beta-xylosidase
VWNEPNIDYWKGTPEEFHKLYDFAIDGVRRALPTARVGGPETAGGPGGRFLHNFLEHCLRGTNYVTGKVGSPLDFIAFHAKGNPQFVRGEGGHVRMGIANQLRDIDAGFATVAAFPELKNLPIVIGESDPEGCAACKGPQNGYRNGTMYSSYTAASFARKYLLADKHGINFEGALTWAFEFENQPYFAGFRALASNGVDHPVLNVFRMMAKMSGQRLAATSTHASELGAMLQSGVRQAPDVAALASLDAPAKQLCVLAWHYHDDDVRGPDAKVELALGGLPLNARQLSMRQFRVDAEHSNAFEVWKAMGSPQTPTPEQYTQLEKAGQLAQIGAAQMLEATQAGAKVTVTLPRQAVTLLQFTWA